MKRRRIVASALCASARTVGTLCNPRHRRRRRTCPPRQGRLLRRLAISGSDAAGTTVASGRQNTLSMIDCFGPGSDCAAQLCHRLSHARCEDWFLPSRDELELMYKRLHAQRQSRPCLLKRADCIEALGGTCANSRTEVRENVCYDTDQVVSNSVSAARLGDDLYRVHHELLGRAYHQRRSRQAAAILRSNL